MWRYTFNNGWHWSIGLKKLQFKIYEHTTRSSRLCQLLQYAWYVDLSSILLLVFLSFQRFNDWFQRSWLNYNSHATETRRVILLLQFNNPHDLYGLHGLSEIGIEQMCQENVVNFTPFSWKNLKKLRTSIKQNILQNGAL